MIGWLSKFRGMLAGPSPQEAERLRLEHEQRLRAHWAATERPGYVRGYDPRKDPTGTPKGSEAAQKLLGAMGGGLK